MNREEFAEYVSANEVDGRKLCLENGYFCKFLDRNGWCIATSCKRMIELEEANNGNKKAHSIYISSDERIV